MKTLFQTLAASGLCLTLIGCAGGNQSEPRAIQLTDAVAQVTGEFVDSRQERPQLTREVLDGLDGSFMEASVENTGALGYLFLQTRRNDGFPGTVRVWRSEDNVTFAMRQGVLIQTRGFGNDILSTDMRLSSGVLGPAGDGSRSMSIMGGDNKSIRISAVCDVGNQGPETITIIGRSYNTQHVIERCEFRDGVIQNEYWIDGPGGIVWQSRQWAGPDMGYIRFRRLTR